jgi:hypothetical protein
MAGLHTDGTRLAPLAPGLAPAPLAPTRRRRRWAWILDPVESIHETLVTAVMLLRLAFGIAAGLLILVIVGGWLRLGIGSAYEGVVALLSLVSAILFVYATLRFDSAGGWWAGVAACALAVTAMVGYPLWAPPLCAIEGWTACTQRGVAEGLRTAAIPFAVAGGMLLLRPPWRPPREEEW